MRLIWLCALVSILASAERVHAAELAWRSTTACDHRVRVAAEAERLIGQPLEDVESADFAVTIRDLVDAKVELQIVTTPRNPALDASSRTLVGASCGELVDAAALAIAMTVSSYQSRAEPEVQAEAPAQAAEQVPVARAPVQYGAGVSAALDVGAFQKPAFGVQPRVSLRYRWLTIIPFGVFFPRSTKEAAGGAGAEFRAGAGGLLACAGEAYERVSLDGCVGYELGRMNGQGTSLQRPRAGSSLWSAPRAELQLGVRILQPVWLTASAGITVPTVRKRFEIEGGLVHRPSAVTGRFGLGIEVRL